MEMINNEVVIQEIIETSKTIDTKSNQQNALIEACKNGSLDAVNSLLAIGADVNAIDENDDTALTIASYKGFSEIVALLLEKGADITDARNALRISSYWGFTEIVKLLLEAGVDSRYGDFIEACHRGHTHIVKLLLDKGVDVNERNCYGTPLTQACDIGALRDVSIHPDIVKLLLDYGADINAVNRDGNTALLLACGNGPYEVVTLLLDKGADPHIINKYGDTALMIAQAAGKIEIIELLSKSKLS